MGDTSNPEALKASINSLTGGLGVAFDTTLLGLILSMFMSPPPLCRAKEGGRNPHPHRRLLHRETPAETQRQP
jgi:hypothetical protein